MYLRPRALGGLLVCRGASTLFPNSHEPPQAAWSLLKLNQDTVLQ